MTKIFAFLATLSILALSAVTVQAAPISASTASQNFASVNLLPAATQLFSAAQVVKAVKGMTIVNTANQPITLAIGAAGLEVDELTIGATSAVPVYYPMVISQNQRISIHTSTAILLNGGYTTVNLLYN